MSPPCYTRHRLHQLPPWPPEQLPIPCLPTCADRGRLSKTGLFVYRLESRRFVYAASVKWDLKDLIDPGSGPTIYCAYAITNAGRMLGDAQDARRHQLSLVLIRDDGRAPQGAAVGVFGLLGAGLILSI
jgi:hypothetical protein